ETPRPPPYNNAGLCNKTVPCTFITLPLTVILALSMCYIHLTGCLFAAFFCTTCHFKVNLCCCTGICMCITICICISICLFLSVVVRVHLYVSPWESGKRFFSIPLYVLTCKVIDNKATLTLTLTTSNWWA